MGALNQRSRIKPQPPTIRIERVPIETTTPKPKPKPSPKVPSSSTPNRSSPSLLHRQKQKSKSASPYPTSSDELPRKRKAAGGSRSPASNDNVRFDSDDSSASEEGGYDAILGARRKKRRLMRVDANRALRHPRIWSGDETKEGGEKDKDQQRPRELRFIHAAHVASVKEKCKPALGLPEEDVAVELRYPGTRQRERYELVVGKDKIDAVKDMLAVVTFVSDAYLPDSLAQPFLDPSTGLVRQLQKYSNVGDGAAFKAALKDYNKRLFALQRDGAVAARLDTMHSLPPDLVAFILDQVYDRTVAPKVELLSKYENGSDNVYGELLHPFVTDILVDKTGMTSDQVFVDLGSGVGNVVLQAALEIGCESWGCEMMTNACDLAESQLAEFEARCQLWGVAAGQVRLERGDFRTNAAVHEALKRADVVLVNNQAFTSQLNDALVRMFLDLKKGCRIVSLKSFVHEHKSASNDVAMSILDVEALHYPSDYVSWTHQGGTYCISKRK